ncbi:extracellular solute-binding protein [Candidatus Uhrbacteria bacterium]|jgi:multiple sugar transport system substrate-binding protein|nr:extracellular solute-binding protein [Candidatus Uhrbacteria bacterium]
MSILKKPFIALAFVALLTIGAGCGGGGSTVSSLDKVELEIWRVFDDDDTFDTVIDSYRLTHPNVKIDYRELRFDEYQDELVLAIAEGRGPDIFSVHNTWMHEYQDLMEPMPETITTQSQVQQGTVRKEIVIIEREEETMSTRELSSSFVEQVELDVILDYQPDDDVEPEERIYGLPMSMDSLALFYNKDLLDAAGIAEPPNSWSEFQENIIALTTYDANGEIEQSGGAIGSSDNVERSVDIISLLMMQNGANMTDERGRVTFDEVASDVPDDVYPSYDAIAFYTDFANPTKEVYTWDESFESSFEAFANGETAFFIGYSYHTPLLRTTAPKLNFSITTIPQIEGGREVNYANFWVEGVSKSTEFSDWAWSFILFATDEENVPSYLEEAQKPTALRSLISSQLDSEWLGPFASQVLTAESWYKGYDADATDEILKNLIDEILAGVEDPDAVMSSAASRVKQTYSKN